jgi:hypothetical protein
MAKWNLGSYNRFISSAIKSKGLSKNEAVIFYRSMAEKLGRPVFRTDLKNHPVISSRLSNAIVETRSAKGMEKISPPISAGELPPKQSGKNPPLELGENQEEDFEFDSSEDGGIYE